MPPTDGITPPPPSRHPCWPYVVLSALWTLQLSSLAGVLLGCILLPRIQGDDGDTGDHIQSAVTLVYTVAATILCLALTAAEPAVYGAGWMAVRGYLSLQATKLAVSLAIVGLVSQTLVLRRKEGWRPGRRELGVGLGIGGVVVASFVVALVFALFLYRRGQVVGEVGEAAGETEPLLRENAEM